MATFLRWQYTLCEISCTDGKHACDHRPYLQTVRHRKQVAKITNGHRNILEKDSGSCSLDLTIQFDVTRKVSRVRLEAQRT